MTELRIRGGKISRIVVLLAGAAALAAGALRCGTGLDTDSSSSSRVVALFVTNNSSNSVTRFSVNTATGQLSNDFTMGFSGSGVGPVAVDAGRLLLYVTMSASKELKAFSIRASDGNLTQFGSHGITNPPTSLAVHQQSGMVFIYESDGTLQPVSFNNGVYTDQTTSTSGSNASNLIFDLAEKFLYAFDQGSALNSFPISGTGVLSGSAQYYPLQSTVAGGVVINPTNGYIYVAEDVVATAHIAAYSAINGSGLPTSSALLGANGVNYKGVAINESGLQLISVESAQACQWSVDNTSTGHANPDGACDIPAGASYKSIVRLQGTNFFYAADCANNRIRAYKTAPGGLVQAGDTVIPQFSCPTGLAFAYLSGN